MSETAENLRPLAVTRVFMAIVNNHSQLPVAVLGGGPIGLAAAAHLLERGETPLGIVYSTDAKLTRYSVRALEDDRAFFPPYDAIILSRLDFPARHPRAYLDVLAPAPIHAGIDGEAVDLDPPLRFAIRPTALRVRISSRHPGVSPSASLQRVKLPRLGEPRPPRP